MRFYKIVCYSYSVAIYAIFSQKEYNAHRFPNVREHSKKIMKTKKEVSDTFGVSEKTITNWMKAGCPFTRVSEASRRVRPMFHIQAVRAWLENHAKRYAMRKGVK